MTARLAEALRAYWWPAVATLTRVLGDLAAAEDAVQDACAVALEQWPVDGLPANPLAWLIGTARHKATDRIRRDAVRARKEAAANSSPEPASGWAPAGDDELGLILLCCHPALDVEVRVALTLRCVCGLSTSEVAAAFLLPEATVAQRLVRAKRKIRQSGIRFAVPAADQLPPRLAAVLRVVYLVFTAGHTASSGRWLVRDELCDQAVRLARGLARLLPGEPEVAGLLALVLLTDARRPARLDERGRLVLLAEQDRSRWDREKIAEGDLVLREALRAGRPGPYQIQAAVAACHSTAPTAEATDWPQIAGLYAELLRHEFNPVHVANRAVAVAMAEGPAAGLSILDEVAAQPRLARWAQLHIARAQLLTQLGRADQARAAYRTALELGRSEPVRAFLADRLAALP